MRVDIRVPVGRSIPEVVEVITRCEDAGFDGVGVHDHPHSGRDAYVVLALAAVRTRRIRLYPATSSPAVRHPVLLASLAHSLDELAPGRTCLTVAPGFLSARSIGSARATVDTMREAVVALRRLLAGESVAFGDPPSRLTEPRLLTASGLSPGRGSAHGGAGRRGRGRRVPDGRAPPGRGRRRSSPPGGGRPPGWPLAPGISHRVHREHRPSTGALAPRRAGRGSGRLPGIHG